MSLTNLYFIAENSISQQEIVNRVYPVNADKSKFGQVLDKYLSEWRFRCEDFGNPLYIKMYYDVKGQSRLAGVLAKEKPGSDFSLENLGNAYNYFIVNLPDLQLGYYVADGLPADSKVYMASLNFINRPVVNLTYVSCGRLYDETFPLVKKSIKSARQ